MSKSKILVTVLSILILIAFSAFSAEAFYIALHKVPDAQVPDMSYKVAADNLYSDNGYIDYAKNVVIPTSIYDAEQNKTFTDAQEMGLFWTGYDQQTGNMIQIAADTEEGAALVHPDKPTLILVHGMMSDGYYNREGFYVSKKIAKNEFGIDTENDSLARIWHNAGWNVGIFHYERWASEDLIMYYIESKIWATDGKDVGIRYRHLDNTTTDNWTDYCMAEHFAAEYIRAMKLLPAEMGRQEIRLAAHSMGGQLTTASLFLLTELARTGQLPMEQLPDRFAMLDPFFSVNVEDDAGKSLATIGPYKDYVGSDITIRWSGKGLPENNVGAAMIECLKVFEHYGIAVEYYTFNNSTLALAMSCGIIDAIQRYASCTVIVPNYLSLPGRDPFINLSEGHNGVRDWYLCSLYYDAPEDIQGNHIASAASTYEEILALRGRVYIQTQGETTISAADDIFRPVTRARELFSIPAAE
jgi:hypothetical protein